MSLFTINQIWTLALKDKIHSSSTAAHFSSVCKLNNNLSQTEEVGEVGVRAEMLPDRCSRWLTPPTSSDSMLAQIRCVITRWSVAMLI